MWVGTADNGYYLLHILRLRFYYKLDNSLFMIIQNKIIMK